MAAMPAFLTLIVILAVASLLRRAAIRAALEEPPGASSPLAEALKDFLALAAGIYVAMAGIVEFLKLNPPDRIGLWGVEFDPLAALSLVLAILQPYFGFSRLDQKR